MTAANENHATMTDGRTLSAMRDMVIIEPRDEWGDAGAVHLPPNYHDDSHGSDGDYIRARNKLCLGIVRAVGPGCWRQTKDGAPWRMPPPVEPGEQVLYDRASAMRVDDREHMPTLILLPQDAVLLSVVGNVRQVLGGLVSEKE